MKKKLLFMLAMMALVLPQSVVAQEMYTEFNPNTKTLTFYYDMYKSSRTGVVCMTQQEWEALASVVTDVVFDESFADARPTSTKSWFSGFTKLEGFDDSSIKNLNTSEVTDMCGMFEGCESLLYLDLSSFDTSKVRDMSDMFNGCFSLTYLNLSSFDTSSVREMLQMFKNCMSLTYLNLIHFDTSNVWTMYAMFQGCKRLKTLNLTFFDVSKCQEFQFMFDGCSALTTIYSGSEWTNEAVSVKPDGDVNMFRGCTSLVGENDGYFDPDCTNMDYAFVGTSYMLGYFRKPVLTIGGVPVTQPGPVNLPYIEEGTVTYSEGDRVGDYPTLTLEDVTMEIFPDEDVGDYAACDGIVAPDGLVIVMKGDNEITSFGTTIFGWDVFPMGSGMLVAESSGGYGIHLIGSAALSASEGDDDVCGVYVAGKLGAVHGQKRLKKDKSGYWTPSIIANNMVLGLRSDYKHPVVSGIGAIPDTDNSWGKAKVVFSYESYRFDKDEQTVVTMPSESVVTKPFYILPKKYIENYGVYIGGEQINYWNYDEFYPMSLTHGYVEYDPDEHELHLERARFDYPYEPTDDNYGLQCWQMPQLKVVVEGDCSLTGTLTDDFDYGINFSADGSGTTTKPQWSIQAAKPDEPATLTLAGTLLFQSTDYTGADVLIKDLNVNVTDAAYLWGEDDIDVTIDNSNVILIDTKYPNMNIMEYLNSLTLTNCHFQDGCYWSDEESCVMDAKGNEAKRLVVIARDGEVVGIGEASPLNDKEERIKNGSTGSPQDGRGGVYNLNGQRLVTPRKGLNIIDGKIVVVK